MLLKQKKLVEIMVLENGLMLSHSYKYFFFKTLYRTSQFLWLEPPGFSAVSVENMTSLTSVTKFCYVQTFISTVVLQLIKKKKKVKRLFLTSESLQCFYPQSIFKENDTGFVHGIAHAEICGILNYVSWEGKKYFHA